MAFARRGGSPRRARLRHHADDEDIGGGGGGDYVAGAVHFDGSTLIRRLSGLTGAADSSTGLLAVWLKFPLRDVSQYFDFFEMTYAPPHESSAGPQFGGYDNGGLTTILYTSISGLPGDFYFETQGDPPGFTIDAWVCHLQTWDVNREQGSKLQQYYCGDTSTDIENTGDTSDFFEPWVIPYSEVQTITLGASGISEDPPNFDYVGDMADFRFWPGVTADLSDVNVRRLFLDGNGKPVNPTVANAELGTPKILFSGDASAFATNQGDGGVFTVTAGSLTNATTSPSN